MRIFINMKFREVLAEQLMLMENVAQAEKVLKQLNIPLDNPDYLRVKNRVVGDNSTGFLGLVVKLAAKWAKDAKAIGDFEGVKIVVNNDTIFNRAEKLYDEIKKHREDLQFLPQNINNYDNIDSLIEDLKNIPNNKLVKKFANLIINKELKNEYIANHPKSQEETQLVKRYLDVIHNTSYGKMFVKKINRYNTIEGLLNYLKIVSKFYDLNISYESILNKAKNRSDLQIVYNQKERIILLIGSYDAMRDVGSPSWCIYDSRTQYENYTKNGSANQYIFYDFGDEVTDVSYSMIGFTMSGSEITASHLMNDDHINDVMSYLNKIGVYPKLRIINTELEKIRRDKEIIKNNINIINQLEDSDVPDREKQRQYNTSILNMINAIVVDLDRYVYSEEFLDELPYANINPYDVKDNSLTKKYRDLFTKFLNDTEKMNYDVLITKIGNMVKLLQDYVYMRFGWDYDEDDRYVVLEKVKKVNLLSKGFFNYVNKRPDILAALKKVFINFKDMQPETYSTFIDAFYNWDVTEDEVNKLIRLRKTKQGEDYSDVEFHRIKNTGDLSSIILNKLQRIRRGEEVSLSISEVQYGIDKGLKNILVNHYRKLLPRFSYNQVEYEYARIYQALGLIKELKDIILKKYNMMGGDQNPNSINSIERSVLDVG